MQAALSYLSMKHLPDLRGQAGLDRLRRLSRLALADAIERVGAKTSLVQTSALGAPRASNGWYISKTHTKGLAAAAVCSTPIGIDGEWIGRPRLRAARESAQAAELSLLGTAPSSEAESLVLLWTGKEAVLKRAGLGLTGISRCRLIDNLGDDRLLFELDGESYGVHAHRIGEYWLSVSSSSEPSLVELTEITSAKAGRVHA